MQWGSVADKTMSFGPAARAKEPRIAGPYGASKGVTVPARAATGSEKVGARPKDAAVAKPIGSPADATPTLFAPEAEKLSLVKKLAKLKETNKQANAKWWSFCKVHGEGKLDANTHDVPFLLTFFESFDLNEIPDEPGCPFVVTRAASPKSICSPVGEAAAVGAPKPVGCTGGRPQPKAAPSTPSPQQRLFVAGLPKTATEDSLRQHFKWYGTVESVDLKYDLDGGFRGFGFVTFAEKDAAQKAVDTKDASCFQGKWIDCQIASGSKGEKAGKGEKGEKGQKGQKGEKG